MSTFSHLRSFAMYLYDEAVEQGMTPDRAKIKVLEQLTQAAQEFATSGGLEFSGLGIMNPKMVLDKCIQQAKELVKDTQHNLPAQNKAKQLHADLQAFKNLVQR